LEREVARCTTPPKQPRRHAWIETKNEQEEEKAIRKTSARVEKKIFAVEKAAATRTSLGYRGPKKSFGPVRASAKLVR
jgi:hypothetical protein